MRKITESEAMALGFLDAEADEFYTTQLYFDREEWLKGRTKTLGASDAAAVIGKSPWMTELDLWKAKTGKAKPTKSNADMERGHLSEEHIRELYAIEMGRTVYDGTGIILTSKYFPCMSCTLDGIIAPKSGERTPTILEIKSVNFHQGWQGDEIPTHYLAQVLHQMAVTGWEKAILRARFCAHEGWEMASERSYQFLYEDYKDQINALVDREEMFWRKYVVGGKRPPVTMPVI